ncbi:DNA-processing protein DprA [Oscillochloris sp. ZM17-4]|uniref:DNA-processing protein DprA n=1 Tax=Oscillochloris sp. ZM17-4 TaxID=2866714 RepID=UPI001C73DBBA|nr:DNA-processing protein DprA [Oscillochloris sp. ZM17-4]MBX0330047.1 DNA-processing protein DprA [Oscillochloris sp. ZM17-4]
MAPPNTRYYLGFNLVPGVGPARLARLIAHCGSVEAAWRADDLDLVMAGLDARSSAALRSARAQLDLDAELERADRAGVALLSIEDPAYPALLRAAPGAPPLIYVRGSLALADAWAVAVVGTRSPTSYGREVAHRLSHDLAQRGVTVVSGLAIGVDSVAHAAALEAGGRTVAVLGSGVDLPYPERNRAMAERIIAQGALVSDYPLGTRPVAMNFPPRNRLISGMSLGTVVVEAGERSGALITVEFALEQGRDVFAVPGHIFSRQSAGTHRLLRDGATLVTCAGDILEGLNLTDAAVQHEARAELPTDPIELAMIELLGYEPQHIDGLGRAAGMPPAQVAAALAILELKGLVRQVGPMEYVRRH